MHVTQMLCILHSFASGYGGLQSTSDGLHSSSDGFQPTSDDTRSEAITLPRSEAIVFLRSEATTSHPRRPQNLAEGPDFLTQLRSVLPDLRRRSPARAPQRPSGQSDRRVR